MKWDIIKTTWQYKEPKFWSKCNWSHRFTDWRVGLYSPDEQNCLCKQCQVWWAKGLNRHERSYPPMFNIIEGISKINEPFWYTEGEAGIKRNPIYTDDNRWLNGKGVALKRERYPDI